MRFKASIIGGAGGMGQWFARHLSHLGYRIKISDVDTDRMKELANIFNYQLSKSNIDAVVDVLGPVGSNVTFIGTTNPFLPSNSPSVITEIGNEVG